MVRCGLVSDDRVIDGGRSTAGGGVTGDEGVCQFPTGPGAVCGRPIERLGTPGRPSRYCELAEHTRLTAFAARRALERAALTGPTPAPDPPDQPDVDATWPVTGGQLRFGALLALFEQTARRAHQTAGEQHAQLAALLERAIDVARTVVDPDAASYEIDQIHRQTSIQLAEAHSARADAERDARDQHRRAEAQSELRARADELAEQALAELEAMRRQTAETITRVNTEADAAIIHAREEAERRCARVEAERDRILAQRADEAQRKLDQVRSEAAARVAEAERIAEAARREANTQILGARRQISDADTARSRAEAERAATERRASEDRDIAQRLRAELARLREQHHSELAALRHEAAEERAALRRDAAHQLSTVLARLDPTPRSTMRTTPRHPPNDVTEPTKKM